jgi:hypothetical protein
MAAGRGERQKFKLLPREEVLKKNFGNDDEDLFEKNNIIVRLWCTYEESVFCNSSKE